VATYLVITAARHRRRIVAPQPFKKSFEIVPAFAVEADPAAGSGDRLAPAFG
jgi:hypothetical protein